MIAEVSEESGFASGLRSVSADSADAEKRNGAIAIGAIHFFGCEF